MLIMLLLEVVDGAKRVHISLVTLDAHVVVDVVCWYADVFFSVYQSWHTRS